MYDKLTQEQKNAVRAKGAVIVTAAAGSGKTAVLTERVIDRLKNGSISADRLLIVTFTNAAAAEMKARIEKRLAEECDKYPNNIYLLKQRILISSADICTIDSFCIKLIRNNFNLVKIHGANLSPDFKIADGSIESLIAKKVLADVFEEKYNNNDEEFLEFLKSTDSVYGDDNAADMILKLYYKMLSLPFYREKFEEMQNDYNPDDIINSKWLTTLFELIIKRFSENVSNILINKPIFSLDEKVGDKMLEFLEEYENYFKSSVKKAEEKDYSSLRSIVINPPKKPSFRAKFDEALKAKAKAFFAGLQSSIDDFLPIFGSSFDELKEEFKICKKMSGQIVKLCKEFDLRFEKELVKKGYLTFALSEQHALNILSNTENNEIADLYDEVMVDEFQDVNELQNQLFNTLSKNGKKLFTVGDAKQSIYGFRNANPDFFIKRGKEAQFYNEETPDDVLKRIVLSSNFRSRKGVCDFVNGFFELAMSEKFGGMNYDDYEKLNPKAVYFEKNESDTEIFLNNSSTNNSELTAKYILKCVKEKMQVQDGFDEDNKPITRDVNFGDFAILFRASGKFENYFEIFEKYNIPISISTGNFFETNEIKSIISFLTAINSPMNDCALMSVLMSPIFGFTADDIADLKSDNKNSRLYKLITQEVSKGNKKFENFYKTFSMYRQKAACMPIADFISFFFEHSDFKNYFASINDGERRVNNLIYFEQLAFDFVGEYAGDLTGFLNQLKFLEKEGSVKSNNGQRENSVIFSTMHASKGLQYPIVIVSETESNFSNKDVLSEISYDENLGLSFNIVDDDAAKKITATSKKIMNMYVAQKTREEELRLLYVVMTRAKEKLVFFISNSGTKSAPFNAAANLLQTYLEPEKGIKSGAFINSKNMAVWIGMYALLLPDFEDLRLDLGITNDMIPLWVKEKGNTAKGYIINDEDILKDEAVDEISVETDNSAESDEIYNFDEAFEYKYPYEELRSVEAKTSVSKLAKKEADRQFCATSRPAFLSKEGLSPTERGTALHKFMQYADFKNAQKNIQGEIDRLYEYEFISEAEREVIEPEKIARFINTDIFTRMLKSDKIFKEQRFLLEVKAGDIYNDLREENKNEKIIIQGAVDCMFIENGSIVLIDFKTDRTNSPEFLLEHYSEQLKIYSVAAEKMFGKKVKECYIYSLYMGKWIEV